MTIISDGVKATNGPMDKAMANTLDLAAYLDRLNWHGPTERAYATLYQARALGRLSGSTFSLVGLCDSLSLHGS